MIAYLPPEAIAAAAEAIRAEMRASREVEPDKLARVALEAAAPAIRADERARIRSLLPYNVNCCDGFPAAVADLIGEHGD